MHPGLSMEESIHSYESFLKLNDFDTDKLSFFNSI